MKLADLYPSCAFFSHEGHEVINVNEKFASTLTLGQQVADSISKIVGSWPFIIIQSIFLAVWIIVNVFLVYKVTIDPAYFQSWDPYPFILLNLMLSFQAAYTGPIVLMSQNREAAKDRLAAEVNYEINKKAEEEIKAIMKHLCAQDITLQQIAGNLMNGEQNHA